MTKATDVRYGRRGGTWIGHRPGQLLAELRLLRNRLKATGRWAEPVDQTRLFHPDTIAAARAHDHQCRRTHKAGETCPAQADPEDVEVIWAGRARMATARLAAGVVLDDLDHQALERAQSAQRKGA